VEFPWFAEQLLDGKTVVIDDIEKMSSEAVKEQAVFRSLGVKSFLMVPLLVDEKVAGTYLFSTFRKPRVWVKETISELRLVSQNLAGAFARAWAAEEIEKLKDQLQDENVYLREEVRVAHGFDEIIGNNEQLQSSLRAVEKIAPTDITVLILGETGTGKELIARAVHNLSSRRDKPMICVNCPALPADLIESELFGHEKGAFTGAQAMRKGRFELANGGTLFLDELGELPTKLQSKLLRVLQTGEFERLGGTETLQADVRLIAATNRDLKQAVDQGDFRADLFYRINTFPISLPALRERAGDIPLLAEHFVHKHAERFGKDITALSAAMLKEILAYQWPGNVRELESIIERSLISSGNDTVLKLSGPLTAAIEVSATSTNSRPEKPGDLATINRAHIIRVLDQTAWTIAGKGGAASVLGMPPSTLRSKMKRLRIVRDYAHSP
jgi:transcriptional regulator with GAF, ATPase, and Fis domain